MKANELIRQYQAKTITARELVEGVWERYVEWQQVTPERGVLNGFREIYHGAVNTFPQPESAAWAVAADFTISRIEEIRLSEEDTLLIFKKMAACNLRRKESYQRILAREQAALDSLRRGMKQPAAQTATGKPAPMGGDLNDSRIQI